MTQFVFLHGPGAGGCADSFAYQMQHFPGSLAPHLPGHLEGESLPDVASYTRWLHDWLEAQGAQQELVLMGFTLGACIGLQYALDYPEQVKALVLMTVSMAPKQRPPGSLEFRLKAAAEPETYQKWLEDMDHALMFVDDPGLREQLMERHRQVGPLSQHRDLVVIDQFDVRDRIQELRAPLLLIRGVDDPRQPPEYELDLHQAVPGSRYLKLKNAGHFPMVEQPEVVNQAVDDFLASIV